MKKSTKIIENLEIQLEELKELIQTREGKIDNMSEKWQESDKCEEWEDKTQEIEEQAEQLENVICELQEIFWK